MQFSKKQNNTKSKAFFQRSKRNSAVGIDINQYSIKMVELSGDGLNRVNLQKYVITKLPRDIVLGNKVQDYEKIVTYLQQSYAELNTKAEKFVAALPQSLVTIENEIYNKKETGLSLESFAEFKVSQILPVEEASFDYQATEGTGTNGQNITLVAAKKDDVEPLIEVFETAGFPLSVMDVDLFAQNNAFFYWINRRAPELEHEKIAVFYVYPTWMYAVIIQNGQILYKQESSAVGVEQLVQLIQNTYQINAEKASQIMQAATKPDDYQSAVIEPFNIQVAQETQRVLQFYYAMYLGDQSGKDADIKRIVLSGAVAGQAGLAETVSAHTNINTECVSPILYTDYNKVDDSKLQIDAPELTLAFGLALRGL